MVSECGAVLTVTFTTPVSPIVLSFLFCKMMMTMMMTIGMVMMKMGLTGMMRMAIGNSDS